MIFEQPSKVRFTTLQANTSKGFDKMSIQQFATHSMNLHPQPYEMIKSGQKTIELRLYDEKRQAIRVGDEIVFTNNAGGETLRAKVVKLHVFDNFSELYASLPLLQCGYTTEDIDTATPADMEKYYSIEKQGKYGVVGIEIVLT